MELQIARQILDTLAQGIHPATGEAMPEDSPYNAPPVIRALHAVAQALAHALHDADGAALHPQRLVESAIVGIRIHKHGGPEEMQFETVNLPPPGYLDVLFREA